MAEAAQHEAEVPPEVSTRKPARLEVCALLSKPSRREVEIRARWIGFEIPDAFVVGYGIDYAQRDRNLSYIGKVRFLDEPPAQTQTPVVEGADRSSEA